MFFTGVVLIIVWFSQFIIRTDNAIRVRARDQNFVIMGYFPNWARWRVKPYSYTLDQVNGSLITHLIYAFLKTNEAGDLINDCPEDYVALQAFKQKYPLVKVLISIGGYGDNSVAFKKIGLNPTAINAFSTNALNLVQKYGFDGIDLDWEYPNADEKLSYTEIIKALYYKLKIVAGFNKYLLTSAVPVGIKQIDEGFDITTMNNYLDYVNLMAYDFNGMWNDKIGHNSPLFSNNELNVNYAVNHWLKKGLNYRKLVLGLAFYGRTFVLKDPTQTWPGSSADLLSKPTAGPYTKSAGFMSYYEVINNAWPEVWDDNSKVPYASQGNQWISYENKKSINFKMKYACLKLLPGFMIWDLSMDDITDGLLPFVKKKSRQGCPLILFNY